MTVGFGSVLVFPAGAVGATAGSAEGDAGAVQIARHGGMDRYETSLQVAEAVAADTGGSLTHVVMVSGRSWPDAVVAAPVAGALGAPVLMTPPRTLRDDAAAFLQRTSVTDVVVVGSTSGANAVGDAVVAALEGLGIAVERVGRADRYATGVVAARQISPVGEMPGFGTTAIIANGDVFADALVAGPFAARGPHPMLLTPRDRLHPGVAEYLSEAGISHVVLMGGTAALSEAVERSIASAGIVVTRLAGATRFDTAVKAARLVDGRYAEGSQRCFTSERIGLARARVPFDSFSAGPLLGRLCAPLLLVDPDNIPPDTAAYLDEARETNPSVGLRVFGGDAAVSEAAINAYVGGREPDDETESVGTVVLPAGTCGGAIDDPPRQLIDRPAQNPAWSADCSRLVHSEQGSLWTMRNDGTDRRLLVQSDGGYLDVPVFSPDGTRIAYTRQINHGTHVEQHIWAVNADGSGKAQLTSGDVWDSTASWSPDGAHIAFSRHSSNGRDPDGEPIDGDTQIAVMDADGTNLTSLTAGGPGDRHPAWSPDGTRIAYLSEGVVWIVGPGGQNAMAVVGDAFYDGGLSWSPDGTRIAFARGDGTESSIIAVEVDGWDAEIIADLGGRDFHPRWSPDGQSIAFDRCIDADTCRIFTAGASGKPLTTGAQQCRPTGSGDGVTAGFPLPGWAVPAKGTLRVAVLFMDFPDAQAAHTTREEIGQALELAEEYLEKSSYRKLDVQFVPHHTWLRAREPYSAYATKLFLGESLVQPASEHAVEIADPDFDFSHIDLVINVFPSTHFHGGNGTGRVSADGATMDSSRINTEPRDEPVELSEAAAILGEEEWGSGAANAIEHELAHNLGLLDMYPFTSVHEQPDPPSGHRWIRVQFGRMGLHAYFLAANDDKRTRVVYRWPDGGTSARHDPYLGLLEMLAWSRWQLGWLHERQVDCVTGDDATVALAPVARTGSAVAMAAVPLSHHEVIVIESRRKLGYDRDHDYTDSHGGRSQHIGLIEEGVLVYTVDTFVDSGQLPLKVAGDPGNGQVDDFPVLTVGESVTVAGWTITVTGDTGDTHTVTITRNT